MDPSTEKIDCLIKYRVMKDIGLSFDIVFSSVMAAWWLKLLTLGLVEKTAIRKEKTAHRSNKHGSVDLVCFVLFSLMIYVIVW